MPDLNRQTGISAWTAGLVALGFGVYQVAQPGVLTGVLDVLGYDDGVYSGVSIRLVHGALPYRDFVYVHPPGMALLLAPTALLGMATTTHTAVVVDRLLTVVVTALNPVLVGLLLRRSGRVAVAVAAFSLALWPITVGIDRGTSLEPYLVALVLLGALVLFGEDGEGRATSGGRLVAGGILFGAACAVKLWGFLPAVAAIAVTAVVYRTRARWMVAGFLGTLLLTCLPFFLAAPHAFWHDVVVDQLGRQKITPTPFGERLRYIAGLSSIEVPPAITAPLWLVDLGFGVLVALAAGAYGLDRRLRTPAEWYLAAAAVITFGGMLLSPVAADFYAYLPAAMLVPLAGVGVSWAWKGLRRGATGAGLARAIRPTGIVIAAGLVALAVYAGDRQVRFDRAYLAGAWYPSGLDGYVPPGSCVLTSFPPALSVTNRLVSSSSSCPPVLDPFGMYLAEDDGRLPNPSGPYPVSFSFEWFRDLERADYFVAVVPYSDFVPWNQFMISWFQDHYRLAGVLRDPDPTPLPNDSAATFYIYEQSR